MILVTGGTGVLGQHVVRLLTERSAKVRILSRRRRWFDGVEVVRRDLVTGEGLAQALGRSTCSSIARATRDTGTTMWRTRTDCLKRPIVRMLPTSSTSPSSVSTASRGVITGQARSGDAHPRLEVAVDAVAGTQFHDFVLQIAAGHEMTPGAHSSAARGVAS
jgi:NAD(P)-dependent dehydrogenase (short-subunit alcohol dehydrogenase family)